MGGVNLLQDGVHGREQVFRKEAINHKEHALLAHRRDADELEHEDGKGKDGHEYVEGDL